MAGRNGYGGRKNERAKYNNRGVDLYAGTQATDRKRESERMSMVVGVVGGVGADGAGVKLNAWHMVA